VHAASALAATLGRVVRHPGGAFGAGLVLLILLTAILAPGIAPHDPNRLDVVSAFAPPSGGHWLGTDQLGRDLLSRHIFGTRIAMAVALSVIAIALAAGMLLGVLSAYTSGPVERAILVAFDSISSFPSVILAMAAVAVLGSSMPMLIVVIATSLIPHYGRVARAQVLSARNEPYVEAEQVLGASGVRILLAHIVPNIIAPLIVIASLDIPVVIAIEASLSFLGLGLRPPLTSWGGLLQDGYQNLARSALPVMVSSGVLAVATLAFTMFGEALRHAIDPRSGRRA